MPFVSQKFTLLEEKQFQLIRIIKWSTEYLREMESATQSNVNQHQQQAIHHSEREFVLVMTLFPINMKGVRESSRPHTSPTIVYHYCHLVQQQRQLACAHIVNSLANEAFVFITLRSVIDFDREKYHNVNIRSKWIFLEYLFSKFTFNRFFSKCFLLCANFFTKISNCVALQLPHNLTFGWHTFCVHKHKGHTSIGCDS